MASFLGPWALAAASLLLGIGLQSASATGGRKHGRKSHHSVEPHSPAKASSDLASDTASHVLPPGRVHVNDLATTSASLVFSAGDANVTCYRIPAIVRQPQTGVLLAFAEARHGSCADGGTREIAMRRSSDGGRTWSHVSFAAGSVDNPVGNPYPIALRSGRIVLVYVKHGPEDACPNGGCGSGNGVVFSDDSGATWSMERDVSHEFGAAKGALPGPGAGVEVETTAPGIASPQGRLLVVSHRGAYIQDHITFSNDGGETWQSLNHTFPAMDEGTFADLGGGQVLLSMRHREEGVAGRALSRSFDGGLTWSPIEYSSQLFGPVCQGSLMFYGGYIYHANPASRSSRGQLSVRRSRDGGSTWPDALLVQSRRSFGYSSMVQGSIGNKTGYSGILFESQPRGSISFSTFPLDFSQVARPHVS